MSTHYDVVVIAAGPGGYVAAIRAAQLGAKVAVIDPREGGGGTCLNVGCIPTKALVQSAWLLDHMKKAEQFGVVATDIKLDFGKAVRNKNKTVEGLVRGVTGLIKANGIDFLHGMAQFVDANTVAIGSDQITFDKAIVATGSSPARPPIPGIDDSRCVDSTGMLALEEQPKRVLVLGGGVIGCEFASIYASFGSEVTIVEMLPSIIPNEDVDAIVALQKDFKKKKITVRAGSRVERLEGAASGVTAHFSNDKGGGSVEADIVLVSTGRTPNVADVGLEAAGVSYDPRAGIAVNAEMRTNVSNIFAIGDVAGKWQLAHTASREGEVAAENALGHPALVDYKAVPRVVYTDPEVAAVGLTEAQAKEQYGADNIQTGTFPFAANSRAQIYGDTSGFVKVIYEKQYHELLGVVMVGSHVSDMISAGVNALEAESTIETIAFSIQAHPTLAESIKEAGLDALGQVVHMPPKKQPAKV